MENEENQNQVSLRFPPPLEIAPRFPQSHNPDDDSLLAKTQNQKARKEPQRLKKPQPRLQAHPSMRKCFPPAVALCHGRAGGPARGGSGAGYAWPYSAARRCHRMAPFALDRGVDQGGCPYQRLAALAWIIRWLQPLGV